MTESRIEVGKSSTTFVGDATSVFAVHQLKSAIGMWRKFKMIPTRGVTITKMLKAASGYTGKRYTSKQCQQAEDDLKTWLDAMLLATEVTTKA